MRTRIVGVLAVTGLGLIACAQQPLLIQESKLAQAEGLQCRQVTTTGSHMLKRVCTTRAEREEQSARAKESLEASMEYQRNRALIDRATRRETGRP